MSVTSLGCLCQKLKVHLRILDVDIAQHLPQFQVIKIEALSIWKNLAHQCGIDRCGRENPVLCRKPCFYRQKGGKQVKDVQIPMTKADLFLRIFDFAAITLM